MKPKSIGIAALVTLAGFVASDVTAASLRRSESRSRSSQEAIASLTPVGAASGWGRIKVEDSMRRNVTKREVKVELYDLDASTSYTVEADGIELGAVMTDSSGWAELKLESPDDDNPPVPEGLPAAADLQSASVRDASGAFVLEGSFVGLGGGGEGEDLHEEKIVLTDPSASGAAGVAKVEREASGQQEFDTRATGLMVNAAYTIVVDGFTAGMVTADAVGQARLKLESPDDSNPLPPELQPVEDLRMVEWHDGNGDVVLTGMFTGISNDDDDDGDDNGGGDDDDSGDDNGGGDDDGPGDDNGGGDDDDDDDDDDNSGPGIR